MLRSRAGPVYSVRPMKSARWLLLLSSCLASCGTVRQWNEMRTAPMTLADCYEGVEFVATRGGLTADSTHCDRGNGLWQSRWRKRSLDLFRVQRYRLRTEILVDEGSAQAGWVVRYLFDAQEVKDPRRRDDPADADWSDVAQDLEAEALFAGKLQSRLGKKP